MTEIDFRLYQPGDEGPILETFNRTFSESWDEGYVDRTLAQWKWEFLGNPAGHRIMLGMADDGRVACQYAAVPIRVWAGKELSFFHAVDSMVHPDFRSGLRKRGLFLEVADLFFEEFGGKVDHLGFGYPIRPAWRIGERFLGYRLIRNLDYMLLPVEGDLSAPEGIEVREVDRFSPQVDAFEQGLRSGYACMTIKDKPYLDWRYARCPSHDYRILEAWSGSDYRGFVVLRVEGGLVPDSAMIGDSLIAPGDGEALRALVAAVLVLARANDCSQLLTVQNPELSQYDALCSLGFAPQPSSQWLERKLGSRDWTSGLDQEWLAQHWNYCLGDSDLF
jgi:hypothetical protein